MCDSLDIMHKIWMWVSIHDLIVSNFAIDESLN